MDLLNWTITKKDGKNLYKIVDIQDKVYKLKCIVFKEKEDLGDSIYCTNLFQEIWVAEYFIDSMVCIVVE